MDKLKNSFVRRRAAQRHMCHPPVPGEGTECINNANANKHHTRFIRFVATNNPEPARTAGTPAVEMRKQTSYGVRTAFRASNTTPREDVGAAATASPSSAISGAVGASRASRTDTTYTSSAYAHCPARGATRVSAPPAARGNRGAARGRRTRAHTLTSADAGPRELGEELLLLAHDERVASALFVAHAQPPGSGHGRSPRGHARPARDRHLRDRERERRGPAHDGARRAPAHAPAPAASRARAQCRLVLPRRGCPRRARAAVPRAELLHKRRLARRGRRALHPTGPRERMRRVRERRERQREGRRCAFAAHAPVERAPHHVRRALERAAPHGGQHQVSVLRLKAGRLTSAPRRRIQLRSAARRH